MRGGVLERSEGLVLLQALREVLGGLCIEVIAAQTAKQDPITVSGGADSRQAVRGGVLERSEGRILL